jgi:hypothetical protein
MLEPLPTPSSERRATPGALRLLLTGKRVEKEAAMIVAVASD